MVNTTLKRQAARSGRRPWLAVLGLLILCGCRSDDAAEDSTGSPDGRQQVTLQLNWFPEAEHGGFYAAQVHGFFAEEGLKVEVLPGGPNTPVIAAIDLGRADFGVVNADKLLMGRDAGADVVALMAPLQVSPRCIMVHEESNIESFDQLRGVTLAVSSGSSFYPFLEKKIDLKDVKIVAYSGSVAPFLNDKRYAQQAYVFSEPYIAEQGGAKVKNLMVADLGFNPYASTLAISGKELQESPELAEKMVRACRRGWEQYLRQPERTNRHIAKLNQEMSLEILNYGARALVPLCDTGDEPLGTMTAERWQTLASQMHAAKMLDSADVEGAFQLGGRGD